MKVKRFSVTLFLLALGFANSAYAFSYFPPERIHCMLTSSNRLLCAGFNRGFLVEDTTNANFDEATSQIFTFTSAVSYFTPNLKEAEIFFTFQNKDQKMVKLKTIYTNFRPDMDNGIWDKFSSEIYKCTAGYMNCRIKRA